MEAASAPLARIPSCPRVFLADLQRLETWRANTGASFSGALRHALHVGLDEIERRQLQEAA
jgi:hypothetical protein